MQTILSTFEVVHYRGLDGLSLPRLGPVNLIAGMNGAGKTALIEAVWLFMGRYHPGLFWNTHVLRTDKPVVDPVSRLSGTTIELRGTEGGELHGLRATFKASQGIVRAPVNTPAGQVPTLIRGRLHTWIDGEEVNEPAASVRETPLGVVIHEDPSPPAPRPDCVIDTVSAGRHTNELMTHYSNLVKANRKPGLIQAMKLIGPDIADIEILTDEFGESALSVSTTSGPRLALVDLGGGFDRLFGTYLNFFAARDGMVLVDELENGVHHSVLPELWLRMRAWAKDWNVQVFATTHSAECIDAATAAFADAPEDLCVQKLYRDSESGEPGAATFTGESLEGARGLNLELR